MPSPAIDHSVAVAGTGGTSVTLTALTTTNANVVAVVCFCNDSSSISVSSISDTAGLTWSLRRKVINSTPGNDGPATVEIWSAFSAAALSSDVITVHVSAAMDDWAYTAFGVSGVYSSTNIFDPSAQLPATLTGTGGGPTTPPSVTASTQNADDLLISVWGGSGYIDYVSGSTPPGWTYINGAGSSGGSRWAQVGAVSKQVSASGSQTFMWGTGGSSAVNWCLIGDAFTADTLANTGTLATTEGLDTAAFAGTVTYPALTGALASTEATDRAAFSGIDAWTAITGALAATETPDAAAFAGNVTWPLVAGTLATTEAPDLAAFTGAPGLLPTVTIKLGMQILVNRQSTLGYWVPAIVTGIALDQVPIVFGCWSQGPALGTSGQMGIMLNIADHGTTWVNAGGAP